MIDSKPKYRVAGLVSGEAVSKRIYNEDQKSSFLYTYILLVNINYLSSLLFLIDEHLLACGVVQYVCCATYASRIVVSRFQNLKNLRIYRAKLTHGQLRRARRLYDSLINLSYDLTVNLTLLLLICIHSSHLFYPPSSPSPSK